MSSPPLLLHRLRRFVMTSPTCALCAYPPTACCGDPFPFLDPAGFRTRYRLRGCRIDHNLQYLPCYLRNTLRSVERQKGLRAILNKTREDHRAGRAATMRTETRTRGGTAHAVQPQYRLHLHLHLHLHPLAPLAHSFAPVRDGHQKPGHTTLPFTICLGWDWHVSKSDC